MYVCVLYLVLSYRVVVFFFFFLVIILQRERGCEGGTYEKLNLKINFNVSFSFNT